MERTTVNMELGSFFMPVERLFDSSILGKPAIIGGTSDKNMEILLRILCKT
jgi:hypothetical protein